MSSKKAMKQAQKQAFAKHRSNISNSRIGFKKRKVDDLEMIINSKDRGKAGFSAPANGLFLSRIHYPDKIFLN